MGLNQGKLGEELTELLESEVAIPMPQYTEKFAALLHIEELQMEVDIRHYDLEDATLTPEGQFLILKVKKNKVNEWLFQCNLISTEGLQYIHCFQMKWEF